MQSVSVQNGEISLHGRSVGLDIARSLAILLVVFSHYTYYITSWYGLTPVHAWFFTGDLGVELFFALSGFLIGRILLEIARTDPSWRSLGAFLVRRWMRTLPAYWAWLAVLAVAFPPADHLWKHLLQFGSLTQNLVTPMPMDGWFAVSWSLTIEEWFYILFAVGAVASVRLLGRPQAIWLPVALLLIVPFAARLATPSLVDWPNGLTKLVPLRLDEIGYGVVMAGLYARRSWIFRYPLLPLACGLGLIVATWFYLLPISFPFYVESQFNICVLGCALCLPAALSIRRVPRWLGATARTLSRLSYSLYLIHLTVLGDVAQRLVSLQIVRPALAIVIAVVLPVLLAELMSRCIEQPMMRLRPAQWPTPPQRNRTIGTEAAVVPT